MNTNNYLTKLSHRNQIINNISQNTKNIQQLTPIEWYKTYMPFLPDELINSIPELIKTKKQINEIENCFEYFNELYKIE